MGDNKHIPSWINAQLFKDVLEKCVVDFKEIKNFQIKSALAPGENYSSVMLKVYIECILRNGQTTDHTFMLKVPHDNELYHSELVKWHMFETEKGMYRHIMPAFEKLYRDKGFQIQFGAKAYVLPTKQEYILLEDLSRRGFRNANRQDCLDMNHCKGVLKKLAQLHAASAVWVQHNGNFPALYTEGMILKEGRGLMDSMLNGAFQHVLKAVDRSHINKEYYNRLKHFGNHLIEAIYDQPQWDENDFNILNHGDCWSNNIMFQYDADGNLKETYFVDLQIPRYGSPAQDLIYFILSSTQYELKVKRFDEMIRYYYDQLIEHLKILDYQKALPHLRDIHQMIIKSNIWATITILITMAAVLCDRTDTASVDNFVSNSEESQTFKEFLYSNERFVKHLEIVIPWLCNRGAFEL